MLEAFAATKLSVVADNPIFQLVLNYAEGLGDLLEVIYAQIARGALPYGFKLRVNLTGFRSFILGS
jgi:hypothetical protein